VNRAWALGMLLIPPLSIASAADSGLAKSGASFLNYSVGARALAMGEAQTAVTPEDATGFYSNPAALGFFDKPSFATTSGALSYDRALYFAGASLPFYWEMGEGFSMKARQTEEESTGEQKEFLVETPEKRLVVSAGATFFRIDNIEARSDFGDPTGTLQDIERAYYVSFAILAYKNLSFGGTAKMLRQSIDSASAKATTGDAGVMYELPAFKIGQIDLSFVARDFGSDLKWTVDDPTLHTQYTYTEPIVSKYIAGAAYTTPTGKWMLALDGVKGESQQPQLHTGLEWRADDHFKLRLGSNAYDPTLGFGFAWPLKSMDLKFDYAFQYSLNNLQSPHWFTLSLNFLPPGFSPERTASSKHL